MRDYQLLDLITINHLLLAELKDIEIAVDMTVGNGYDTVFLAQHFPKVYGFDIQEAAIAKARRIPELAKVQLINDDHINVIKYVKAVDLFVFNLGWLPNSDKVIATQADHTVKTLEICRSLLRKGGLISLLTYQGNPHQKKEKAAVVSWINAHPEFYTQVIKLHRHPKAPQLFMLALKKT